MGHATAWGKSSVLGAADPNAAPSAKNLLGSERVWERLLPMSSETLFLPSGRQSKTGSPSCRRIAGVCTQLIRIQR